MARNRKDITGLKFNMLTVLEVKSYGVKKQCVCRCDCGKLKEFLAPNIVSGHTKSCGCLSSRLRNMHGFSDSAEYRAWVAMKDRCHNKNNTHYSCYGGRGISVCEEWRLSFLSFIADLGERPSINHSIDRIDVNGNYEKNNCRWATREQQRDNKQKTKIYPFNGELKTLAQHCKSVGISYHTAYKRVVRMGWEVERALTEKSKRSAQ